MSEAHESGRDSGREDRPGSLFHDVAFPARLRFGTTLGVRFVTRVSGAADGTEIRTSRQVRGQRVYLLGAGVRALSEASLLLRFFEARHGRLYGFRFRDPTACLSCGPEGVPGPLDQALGTGDGQRTQFSLGVETVAGWQAVHWPVAGTVRVAVGGQVVPEADFSVTRGPGRVTLLTAPPPGAEVRAGFVYDTPVRFDTDRLDLSLQGPGAGAVSAVPLVEILP